MKDDLNELDELEVEQSSETVDEIKYEENDNWKFDGEALTLNDTVIEDENFEISIPAETKENVEPAPQPVQEVTATVPEPEVKKPKTSKIVMRIVIPFVIALVLAFLGVFGYFYFTQPNCDERMNPGNTALTVGNTKVSIGMYNYYYTCIAENYINGAQYGYYPDLDPTKDFSEQTTTDEDGNEITWEQLFRDKTIEQIKFITTYYEGGVEAGIELTDDQNEQIETQLKTFDDEAAEKSTDENPVTVDQYIAEKYGDYCGYATIKKMMEQYFIAQDFYTQRLVTTKATEDEALDYYNEHKADYMYVPIAYLQVGYDGETVTKEDAEKKAKTYAAKIKNVDDLKKALPDACDDIIASYIGQGYFENAKEAVQALSDAVETTVTNNDDTKGALTEAGVNWLFSDDTKVGSCSTFVNEEYQIVYIVLKTGEPKVTDDEVYSVRHILCMPKDDEGNTLEDPTTATPEQLEKAKTTAKGILDKYNNGEKTELSFAKLAEEYSDDTGSTSKAQNGAYGGLCENTKLGMMVKPFEQWSIDKERKYGDVDIVETQYGYHIMFFIEDTTSYMFECSRAVVDQKEKDFVDKTEVKKNESVIKKTRVYEPVTTGSAYDDDSENMDY